MKICEILSDVTLAKRTDVNLSYALTWRQIGQVRAVRVGTFSAFLDASDAVSMAAT